MPSTGLYLIKVMHFSFLLSPVTPKEMDWSELYPIPDGEKNLKNKVQFADIGCGYGGLLSNTFVVIEVALSKLMIFYLQFPYRPCFQTH